MEKITLPNDQVFADVLSMLSDGYTVRLRVKGTSMFPFITGGRDYVFLQKAVRIRTGDIVLAYLSGKYYVLHRVYRIDGDEITLMGDGNVRSQEQCRPEDICGTVLSILRNGRYVSCCSLQEQRKVWLWKKILPVRRYILVIYYYWRKWTGKTDV